VTPNANPTADGQARGPLDRIRRFFFPAMSLLIIGVVAYGFSYTIDENLIHPPYRRPWILYVHVPVFCAWLLLFATQNILIHAGKPVWHRRLGLFGLALGSLIPIIGVATVFAMTKMHVDHGEIEVADSLPIPLFDMVAYSAPFTLGALFRHRSEFHRRLMFIATCALTAAAFGRMPALDHAEWFYSGVDALILLGALRDIAVTRSIHIVYRIGLPAMILGQCVTAYIRWSPEWLALAPNLFR
jgi:hypothetical protein